MNKVKDISWELLLEPPWEAHSDEERDIIFNPDGLGALQISSARKEGSVTDDDLVGLATQYLDAGAKASPAVLGDFSGIAIRYEAEGSHWRQWFLRCGSVALFITYRCADEDGGAEDAQVDRMLETLRAL